MKNFIYTLRIFLALVILTTGCNSKDSDGGGSDTDDTVDSNKEALQSIGLKSAEELPKCSKANNSQLAYIFDEETFYVCQDAEWIDIEISSNDDRGSSESEDGNVWTDPFTKKKWALGGDVTRSQGQSACGVSGFRMPTSQEGLDAVAHGIWAFAEDNSFSKEFWVAENDSNNFPITIRVHLQEVKALGTSAVSRAAYCVKK